jgi:hypothetical protein
MTRLKHIIVRGIAAIALALVLTWGGTVLQLRNIGQAQRHAPIVQQHLSRYPEFRDVRAGVTSSADGALSIYGYVPEERRERLRAVVQETQPPVGVRYFLRKGKAPPGLARQGG